MQILIFPLSQMIHPVDRRGSRLTPDFRFIKEARGALTITNVMVEDNGKWTCEAENAHGYSENARPVKLVVLGECLLYSQSVVHTLNPRWPAIYKSPTKTRRSYGSSWMAWVACGDEKGFVGIIYTHFHTPFMGLNSSCPGWECVFRLRGRVGPTVALSWNVSNDVLKL